MEIVVTLHTAAGDVITCYPRSMLARALQDFTDYITSGKRATVQGV